MEKQLWSIKEFAESRGELPDTVSRWMRNWLRTHPDSTPPIRDGKKILIDAESELYRALNQQYPIPAALVIKDPEVDELKEKLAAAQEQLVAVQQQLLTAKDLMAAMQQKLTSGETDRLRLEIVSEQMENEKQARFKAEQRAEAAEERASDAESALNAEREDRYAAESDMSRMKSERDHLTEDLRSMTEQFKKAEASAISATSEAADAKAELERLRRRGLLARILNK